MESSNTDKKCKLIILTDYDWIQGSKNNSKSVSAGDAFLPNRRNAARCHGRPMIMTELSPVTTHLLSVGHTDCPKLHDMFGACDVKTWQRKFPVGFPVTVFAANLLFTTIFTMLLLV